MTNQELRSYQQMGIPLPKKPRRRYEFSLFEGLEYAICFLLSKIYVFGALSPFGLSYFMAVFPKQKRPLGILAVCLGILGGNMGLSSMKYLGALVISASSVFLLSEELSKKVWLMPFVSALSVFLTGFVFIIFDGFLFYDVLLQLLESVLLFLSYFVFDKAASLIKELKNRTVLDEKESMSLIVLCACLILSLSEHTLFPGMSHILSVLIVFITGLTSGFSLSCAAGVILGIINSVQDVLPAQVIAVYSVSALISGLFQKKGRLFVAIGFLLANAFSVLYISGSSNTIISYYAVLIATALLFFIPDRVLCHVGDLVKSPTFYEDSTERTKNMMAQKLSEAESSFQELSDMFHDVVEHKVNIDVRDPGHMFDKTADKVCRECSLCNYCWQKEYHDTKDALMALYQKMEKSGRAEASEVPKKFKESCINLETFLEELNKNYDVHKINLLWAGKVSESRLLVAEQFKNISSVLSHLQQELLSEPSENMQKERRIQAALERRGIETESVRLYGEENQRVQVIPADCKGAKAKTKEISLAVGSVLGCPMVAVRDVKREQEGVLQFCEQARFSVTAGYAKIAGGNGKKSGDACMYAPSGDGKYILALSDGMGQGCEAEEQSSMTVHLIKHLLSAGFDKETALRLINSMLMVSLDKESFSTADLCLVNLYSGALEFIKIGAANSYVKRGSEVKKITCTSLPVGVVSDFEADCELFYAASGDYVVLVTDGITDVLERERGQSISRLLECFAGDSPQELADTILKAAVCESDGLAQDDMTVLVAKINEV